jgi:hypothetical protein
MILAELKKSTKSTKKFMVILYTKDGRKIATVHFGQLGASDYTVHKDRERMLRYLERHTHDSDWKNVRRLEDLRSSKENWKDPTHAGFWSRWLLWYSKDLQTAKNVIQRKWKIKFI